MNVCFKLLNFCLFILNNFLFSVNLHTSRFLFKKIKINLICFYQRRQSKENAFVYLILLLLSQYVNVSNA